MNGSSLSRSMPAEVGQIIAGTYKVLRSVGRGGMGEVVVAEHLQLRHSVAIKLLAPETVSHTNVARFIQEARVMVRLSSEHVARVLDVGTLDSGLPFIVMEHLRGQDFESLLATTGPFSVEEAVTSIVQVTRALTEAHTKGIVHRDLKPANLFLTSRPDDSWFVKVLDFGISKIPEELGGRGITATADVFGTPAYMSPEQTRSTKQVDARADIWSLGLILAECISGKPVYQGSTQLGILTAVAADPLPSLHLEGTGTPRELESVIRRCLEKNPADRYQDVTELARDLLPFAAGTKIAASKRMGRIVDAGSVCRESTTMPQKTKTYPARAVFPLPKGAAWLAVTGLLVCLGVTLLSRHGRSDMSKSAVAVDAVPTPVDQPEPRGDALTSTVVAAPDTLASLSDDHKPDPKIAALGTKAPTRVTQGTRAARTSPAGVPSDGLHDRK